MKRVVVVVLAGLLLAAATDASAATLGWAYEAGGAQLVYTAAPGEVNRVTARGFVLNGTAYVTFSDPGNWISADTSQGGDAATQTLTTCVFMGSRATCPGDPRWEVRLGDRNDSMTVDAAPDFPPHYTCDAFSGDAGNDTLRGRLEGCTVMRGGEGDDTLLAGGWDWLQGGPGADTMKPLTARTSPIAYVGYQPESGSPQTGVTVTLDGVANDGAPGEGDNVDPYIYEVMGTDGDDSFTGNSIPGHLFLGRAGNDRIDPAGGTGSFYGDEGDDVFTAADGVQQTINCWLGADTVAADPQDNVNSDCENVTRSP